MNYSSVLINTLPEHQDAVIDSLTTSGLCEVHLSEGGKIIIIIEGENTEEEITKLRKIEAIDNILSAEMIYSYVEDHLDDLKKNLEISDDVPSVLNDNSIDAKDINYGGDIKKEI